MPQTLSIKKKILWTLLGVVAGVGALSYILFKSALFQNTRATVEVDWKILGDMDYITGSVPPNLQKLDGTMVKVPGFMVPLEDNQKKVTQFLLVPTPQACIHVPPPPPNQMLLVDMQEGSEVAYGPVWVHGRLKIKTQRTQYGDVSYALEAILVENYQ